MWVVGREEEAAVGGGEGVAVVVPARRGGEGMNCLGPHNQAYTDELPLQEHWSVDLTNTTHHHPTCFLTLHMNPHEVQGGQPVPYTGQMGRRDCRLKFSVIFPSPINHFPINS